MSIYMQIVPCFHEFCFVFLWHSSPAACKTISGISTFLYPSWGYTITISSSNLLLKTAEGNLKLVYEAFFIVELLLHLKYFVQRGKWWVASIFDKCVACQDGSTCWCHKHAAPYSVISFCLLSTKAGSHNSYNLNRFTWAKIIASPGNLLFGDTGSNCVIGE